MKEKKDKCCKEGTDDSCCCSGKEHGQMKSGEDKCCKEDSNESSCCGGHGKEHNHEHGHSHEHGHVELEDVVYNNNILLGTLIGLLIKNKVITEEEFTNELKRLEKEDSE